MGTRADFYIGRGEAAEWLGSTAWDGYPHGFSDAIGRPIMEAASAGDFRASVSAMLASREDGTTPDMGWPWPWSDSSTTDYAYSYADDGVWASNYGGAWFKVDLAAEDDGQPDGKADDEAAVFPNMQTRRALTLGSRSGVMVFGRGGYIPADVIDTVEADERQP